MAKGYEQEISILSEGIKINGNLESNGNVRVDGEFEGDLVISGNLTLGNSSKCKGLLKAKNITCGGKIEGTIEASEKLILESSSAIVGDISANILVINEGASFKGHSNMGKSEEQNLSNEGV